MFTPGPRTTCTPRARASRAIAVPIHSATDGSQLDPTATAGGKQVAGRFSKIPSASKSPACRRTPCGPSVSTTAGRPSTGLVDQKSRPDSSAAFSSRVRPSRSSGETWITARACRTAPSAGKSGAPAARLAVACEEAASSIGGGSHRGRRTHTLGGIGPHASSREVAVATVTGEERPVRRPVSLKREIGLIGLLWASTGSIIGSGWLFGAQKGLVAAGPAAVISWVIGGVAILFLALVHAELGGMYPVS